MTSQLELDKLRELLRNTRKEDIRLYLIWRALKAGVKKSDKILAKYNYTLNRIDIDEGIQAMLLGTIEAARDTLEEPSLKLVQYRAIDEDSDKLYTYFMTNKEMAFADVLKNQINRGLMAPVVTDLAQLLNNTDLWAYCVEVQNDLNKRYLVFTKLNRSKVAVDEKLHPGTGPVKRFFKTRFNMTTAKLELLEGDTINIDRRVDCLYSFVDDLFYIFEKRNFEEIVGIEEEFKAVAQSVVQRIRKAGVVEGLEAVRELLANDTSLHKKLFQIDSTVKAIPIDAKRIKRMRTVARSYKLPLRVTRGKIQISDRQELITLIRLLDDYFLKSPQTGIKYGAPVKNRWVTKKAAAE